MTAPLFSPRARRELLIAAETIATDNVSVAEIFVSVVEESAVRICAKPNLARLEPKLATDRFRFWSLRGFPYLLVIDTAGQSPKIVRIIHQARDLPVALRDL